MATHCITIDLAKQGHRLVRACFDGGRMSSDGGALLLRANQLRLYLALFAAALLEVLLQVGLAGQEVCPRSAW